MYIQPNVLGFQFFTASYYKGSIAGMLVIILISHITGDLNCSSPHCTKTLAKSFCASILPMLVNYSAVQFYGPRRALLISTSLSTLRSA